MLFETQVLMDIYDGRYKEALSLLSEGDIKIINTQFYFNSRSLLYAKTYSLMNMPDKAFACFDSSRIEIESGITANDEDPRLFSALGIAYAGMGLKAKAIKAGKRAVELMPVNKEAFRGVFRVEDLARIYVMIGEYDAALEQIRYLLSIPSRLSVKLLLLDPAWQPLRNMPEFIKIINSPVSEHSNI